MDVVIKRKISNALLGRKKSAITKKLISQALKNQPKTNQHKKAISLAMIAYWRQKNNK